MGERSPVIEHRDLARAEGRYRDEPDEEPSGPGDAKAK